MSIKIVAIDDHPDTIQLIEMALQRHGYEVYGAFSGPEGLEIAERERPDLILLDMMMPGMDGNAVCRSIRQNPDLAKTPIIMFTAKSQALDKKVSFDAGADDYITKPTRPSELLERIEALLARQSTTAQEQDQTQVQPPAKTGVLSRSDDRRLISVIGARGGAGATTVALNIAATIAAEGTDTILVDFDTRQGHAALYIGHTPSAGIQEWLAQPADDLVPTLPDYLVQIDDHLQLLPAQAVISGDGAVLNRTEVDAAATVLSETGQTVVVDLGAHRGDAVNPILRRSALVLICLRPQRAAIVGARQLLEHLQHDIAPDDIQFLMVDFGEGSSIAREAVEAYLDKPLYDAIEIDLKVLTGAVGRHQPLVYAPEEEKVAQQFTHLVRQLAIAT
ncbi:MAG: response regulator [Chloroflexota bacterium]